MIQPISIKKSRTSLSQILNKFIEHPDDVIFQNTEFIFGKNQQYRIEIANDLASRKEAYHLLYDLYSRPEIGFADYDPTEMWYSIFYAHPDTVTFIVREIESKEVVASLTAIVDSELGLPMEVSYPDQIKELRRKGKKCAEMISLGFHDRVRGDRELLIQLIKFSYMYARGVKGVTDYLIMICPRHAVFYEKKFLYLPIGKKKKCKKVKDKFVQLYRLNLEFAEEEVAKSRQLSQKKKSIFNYFNTVAECQGLVKSVKSKNKEMSLEEVKYFFVQQKNQINSASLEQLQCLASSYRNPKVREYFRQEIFERLSYISSFDVSLDEQELSITA